MTGLIKGGRVGKQRGGMTVVAHAKKIQIDAAVAELFLQ